MSAMCDQQPCRDQSGKGGHVGFKRGDEHYKEERKKFLTMKYGIQQMKLVRKRLLVEDWLDGQLRHLYNCEPNQDYQTEVDLDEVMDLASEDDRRELLMEKISNCKRPLDVREKFVNNVLDKMTEL